ncbi:MAG: sigma-70 family RNA polymerase sigma factor [Solirubrobacterales bacterium]
MKVGELEQPLQETALREIERSLHGKLKAHRISESFIERCSEEAVQKGLLDYLRARAAGEEIENRDAFVVHAAFYRAIQELRREARQVDGAAAEALLASGHRAAPPSEELALEELQAQELHAAIDELPSETRQLLALHYFEQLSAKRAAEVLYLSEATYRRRLRRALTALAARLGVPAPDPDSELALEVGFAAWTSLGGARVAFAHGPLEQLAGLLDRGREGLAWISARVRTPLARAEASGATEQAGAIAGGPAGKVLGGCAAAAVVCVVGGTVGLSLARHPAAPVHQNGAAPATQRLKVRAAPKAAAQSQAPIALGLSNTGQQYQTPAVQAPESAKQPKPPPSERQRVERQFSGITRAAAESSAPTEAEASAAGSETVVVAPESGGGTSSSSEPAQQEFGFEGKP